MTVRPLSILTSSLRISGGPPGNGGDRLSRATPRVGKFRVIRSPATACVFPSRTAMCGFTRRSGASDTHTCARAHTASDFRVCVSDKRLSHFRISTERVRSRCTAIRSRGRARKESPKNGRSKQRPLFARPLFDSAESFENSYRIVRIRSNDSAPR